MKKLIRMVAVTLALLLCIGGISTKYVSAKNIYFAGKYKKGDCTLYLNQYSSPEDVEVGNFEIYKGKKKLFYGELSRWGKNKYSACNADGGLDFKVMAKKVKVSEGTITLPKKYKKLMGTYKLKKRYYS